MEGDIALIKGLLWAILGLLVFFVVSNILCRLFNCGQPREPKYGEMWDRGDTRKLLAAADDRLRTHPHDISALYFSAKALAASGQVPEARSRVQRLMLIEPLLHKECKEWLAAFDDQSSSTDN